MTVETGLTRVLSDENYRRVLRDRRVGLVCHAIDLFRGAQDRLGFRLTALFSPQHGFWGQDQDNMIETAHAEWKGIPLYSLYSETRKPTAAMLAEVDTVVVDLQDIGTRIYT